MLHGVAERYGSVAEALLGVAKHYGTLWSIVGHYRLLQKVMQAMRIIVERYGSITEPLWNVMECYGTVSENIEFARH